MLGPGGELSQDHSQGQFPPLTAPRVAAVVVVVAAVVVGLAEGVPC